MKPAERREYVWFAYFVVLIEIPITHWHQTQGITPCSLQTWGLKKLCNNFGPNNEQKPASQCSPAHQWIPIYSQKPVEVRKVVQEYLPGIARDPGPMTFPLCACSMRKQSIVLYAHCPLFHFLAVCVSKTLQCYREPERSKASQVLDVAYKAPVIWPPAYL